VKRRDLLKHIADIAKAQHAEAVWKEGGSHTKITIGARTTMIPRHNEIKEPLARQILRDLTED
jgi:hypothetical protein